MHQAARLPHHRGCLTRAVVGTPAPKQRERASAEKYVHIYLYIYSDAGQGAGWDAGHNECVRGNEKSVCWLEVLKHTHAPVPPA